MALKVKRIKRSMLDELGDGYEVLTEAEVTEAGFTLADDEVVVVEKPQPPEPPTGEAPDVTELRASLHKVNQESASRRIELRELKNKVTTLESENVTLKGNEETHKQTEAKRKAAELFNTVVQKKKVAFVSETAGTDAMEEIFKGVDWKQELKEETLTPLVDQFLEKRPYILKTAVLGKTEGGGQGNPPSEGTIVEIDLNEVAAAFGLPAPKEKTSEGAK